VLVWYQLTVQPGQTAEVRLRLRTPPAKAPRGKANDPLGTQFGQVVAQRQAEADEFYAELTPAGASADEALVMRQAFAGCCGASSCSTTTSPAGWRGTRPSRCPRRSA